MFERKKTLFKAQFICFSSESNKEEPILKKNRRIAMVTHHKCVEKPKKYLCREPVLHSFNSFYTDCHIFSTFLTCVWNPRCSSIVTPKYLQWSDFFTMVEPTITVSKSLRRLSFLREEVMNSANYEFISIIDT